MHDYNSLVVSEELDTMKRDHEINTKHWQDIIDQRANWCI